MSAATIVSSFKYWNWINHQHGDAVSVQYSFSFALLFSILISITLLVSCHRSSKRKATTRLPPSPPGLPIVGNLHQLSSLPHVSLRTLSRQHGPIMLLRLGQIPTLVVSSAAAAQEIMKTHDVAFAGRPSLAAGRALERGGRTISFTPYGDYWRQAKKACVVHLLNSRRVRALRPAREEEVAQLLTSIGASSPGAVDLSRALSSFSTAMIGRALFGRVRAAERSTLERVAELLGMQSALLGGFQVDDFFPSLAWLCAFTSKNSKLKELASSWYAFLDGIVDAHVIRKAEKAEAAEEDFVDVLLSLHGGADKDFVPSIPEIKVMLMDLISAGTDTSYETLEWAMSELVRSPAAMQTLQEEIRSNAGKPTVTEDDVEQMPFLKATIKETLRLHPPTPLLLPRVTMKPVQLLGYDVPANTRVLINAWAIARDPDSWESPEEFRPERFMVESPVDFKGNDFQFIPFGAGRRICPGMHFATSTVEIALANLLHRFEWSLPDGMSGEDLDMEEAPGLTIRRRASLRLVAKPRSISL